MSVRLMVRQSVLATVGFFIAMSALMAQQRFSAGPRVGVNYSTFAGDAAGFSFRPGLVAGGFLMYSSLNHFGISVDALYSQKGGNYSATINLPVVGPTTTTYKQRVNYLEIPVALRYFLTLNGNFRPNIYFGPALGFKLNAEQTSETVQNAAFPAVDNSDQFRSVDLGGLAGFQLNFPGFGARQRFLIDARYTYGLSDITIDNNARINNSAFTLTLGYGFGVGPEYRSRYQRK
ncbi:porin family protein [Spirosoma sp. 209]|uniref:porin family protein n=1 Tax=Spirosoma sp. 209 TaxID=1955701 RepID=UPI00098D1E4C|nr:porin family protein [Spirosoma sp. 209]